MKKIACSMSVLTLFTIVSCNQPKQSTQNSITKSIFQSQEKTIKSTVMDKDGKKLEMSTDSLNDLVTIKFEGETTELKNQKPTSGMWYKNEVYEVRGEGEKVELSKNGVVVFTTVNENTEITKMVSWEEMVKEINKAEYTSIGQDHSLNVYLKMPNGTRLKAKEPKIDAFMSIVMECDKCKNKPMVSE